MKWATSFKPSLPKIGDKRTRIIFAFLPKQCKDGWTRWLERVVVYEEYRECFRAAGEWEYESYYAWSAISYDGLAPAE